MDPSKPLYSIPFGKLVVKEIMKEDSTIGEEGIAHYYVKDEEELGLEGTVGLENTPLINQFLKLVQKQVQATRVFISLW